MENKELIGQISQEQLESWKRQWKDVFQVTVDGHVAYLRKPDRKILSYASSLKVNSPIDYMEALVDGCWLGGSELMRDDDDYFLPLIQKAEELVALKTAELVKL